MVSPALASPAHRVAPQRRAQTGKRFQDRGGAGGNVLPFGQQPGHHRRRCAVSEDRLAVGVIRGRRAVDHVHQARQLHLAAGNPVGGGKTGNGGAAVGAEIGIDTQRQRTGSNGRRVQQVVAYAQFSATHSGVAGNFPHSHAEVHMRTAGVAAGGAYPVHVARVRRKVFVEERAHGLAVNRVGLERRKAGVGHTAADFPVRRVPGERGKRAQEIVRVEVAVEGRRVGCALEGGPRLRVAHAVAQIDLQFAGRGVHCRRGLCRCAGNGAAAAQQGGQCDSQPGAGGVHNGCSLHGCVLLFLSGRRVPRRADWRTAALRPPSDRMRQRYEWSDRMRQRRDSQQLVQRGRRAARIFRRATARSYPDVS